MKLKGFFEILFDSLNRVSYRSASGDIRGLCSVVSFIFFDYNRIMHKFSPLLESSFLEDIVESAYRTHLRSFRATAKTCYKFSRITDSSSATGAQF